MLRTAQEIIDETFERAKKDALVSEIYIMAVNTAVREAIEECANVARPDFNADKYHNQLRVDDKSILDLINQIK